jgi:heme/copper-type cytochrome/quinol oxidase subunit 2
MKNKNRWLWAALSLAAMLVLAVGFSQILIGAQQATREFTLVNIKYEGSNIWVPGPLVVKRGDRVRIRGINNVKDDPAEHGLAIDEFGVKLVVNRGKPETVEFVADKAGIFRVWCHLHLPHVATQLVVLE